MLRENLKNPMNCETPEEKEKTLRKLGVITTISEQLADRTRSCQTNRSLREDILREYGSMDEYKYYQVAAGDLVSRVTNHLIMQDRAQLREFWDRVKDIPLHEPSSHPAMAGRIRTYIWLHKQTEGLMPQTETTGADWIRTLDTEQKSLLLTLGQQAFNTIGMMDMSTLSRDDPEFGQIIGRLEKNNKVADGFKDYLALALDGTVQGDNFVFDFADGNVEANPVYQLYRKKPELFLPTQNLLGLKEMHSHGNRLFMANTMEFYEPTEKGEPPINSRHFMKAFNNGSRMSKDELQYGQKVFQRCFRDQLRDERLQELLADSNQSIYDFVIINGASLSQIARAKGLNLNSDEGKQRIEALAASAALTPENQMAFVAPIKGPDGTLEMDFPHPIQRDGNLKTPPKNIFQRIFGRKDRYRDNSVKFALTRKQNAMLEAMQSAEEGPGIVELKEKAEERVETRRRTEAHYQQTLSVVREAEANALAEANLNYNAEELGRIFNRLKTTHMDRAALARATGYELGLVNFDFDRLYKQRNGEEYEKSSETFLKVKERYEKALNAKEPKTEEEFAKVNEIFDKHLEEYNRNLNGKTFESLKAQQRDLYDSISGLVKKECFDELGLDVSVRKIIENRSKQNEKTLEASKEVTKEATNEPLNLNL